MTKGKVFIPLTKDQTASIDLENYELIREYKWCANKHNNCWYAQTSKKFNNKVQKIYMHRLIMHAKKDQIIDHIDGNSLNNCRSNLRFCSHTENLYNTSARRNNKLGYKGIYWNKKEKKFRCYINVNKKNIHIGYFSTIEDAILSYNQAAQKYHKEFAKLNTFIKGNVA